MQDETMIVLAEYNTITEAEIAKSMLDSAGIWATIRNEYMSAIYPIGTMPAQVVVREEDYEKARAMLHHRKAHGRDAPHAKESAPAQSVAAGAVRIRLRPRAVCSGGVSSFRSRSCSGIRKRSAEVRHLPCGASICLCCRGLHGLPPSTVSDRASRAFHRS